MKSIDKRIKEYKLRRANRLLERMDSARYDYDRPTDDYDWITIRGQHTPIEDGNIAGGIGGKFKGQKYTGTKMQQSKKRLQRLAEKAKSAANGVRKVALRATKAAMRIAKASSINECKDILKDEFGIPTGALASSWRTSDIDDTFTFDHIQSGYVGLSDTITEFPELKTYLASITAVRSGVACFSRNFNQPYIAFNPNYFTDRYKLENTLRRCVDSGWWPKNSSPGSIMAHECAHALQYMIAGKEGKDPTKYCQYLVRRAITNVQKTGYGKGKTPAEMRSGICGQAGDRNTMETVSEAFADCFANGESANPLSIEIRRMVTNDYNKHFGKQ